MLGKIEVSTVEQAPEGALIRLIWVTPLAILAATVANIGLYYAAGNLIPAVATWPASGPAQIAGANIVYLLNGAVILAASARLSSRPARHYLISASIGLLISLALPISAALGSGPPGTPPAGVATVITLSLMHIVSYAISVPLSIHYILE
jgi:hypothetical protein